MKTLLFGIFIICALSLQAQDSIMYKYMDNRKDPSTSALWSVWLDGAGFIYADNDFLALTFFAGELYMGVSTVKAVKNNKHVATYISLSAAMKLLAMALAYNEAKNYNEKLKIELGIAAIGKKPVLNVALNF